MFLANTLEVCERVTSGSLLSGARFLAGGWRRAGGTHCIVIKRLDRIKLKIYAAGPRVDVLKLKRRKTLDRIKLKIYAAGLVVDVDKKFVLNIVGVVKGDDVILF